MRHGSRFPAVLGMLLVCGVLAALAGCATAPPPKEASRDLVWPAPPAPPRLRYLGSLKSLEDLSGKEQKTLRDILLGEEEKENRSLVKPYGVASDSNGRVFVADTGFGGLPVFNTDNGRVSFWGVQGLGALRKPVGVAVDPAGPVYVSDTLANRIVKFDTNGNYLTAFGDQETYPGPGGLVFSEQAQRLYAADSKRHQVLVFTPDGVLERAIGERGSGEGQFNFPTNLAIDREGRLYVADTMNFRIQVLGPDGEFIRQFGSLGDRPGNFNRVKGIGVDSDGNIYGVDASYNNFQVFDAEGRLLIFIGGAGAEGGQFYLPAGLFVDRNDRIYIADQYNKRVQMFQYYPAADADG